MKAVNLKETFDYICDEDQDLPEGDTAVVFVCNHLTARAEALVDDSTGYQGAKGYNVTMGSSNLLALHLGLKAIKGLFDENGQEVVIERDESKHFIIDKIRPIKDEILNQIPKVARYEVSRAIQNGGRLTEAETKN